MEIKNQKQNIQNKEKNVIDDDSTINYRGWKVMPFIIGNETFEKLGTIGTLANILIYLTTVFNLKNITATYIVNIFNGSTNFAPLFGAFLCDTYFGRYKTLGFATASSFLGLLVITLTAAIKNLHPPHCAMESVTCQGPTAGQMAFLFTGFGFLVVGAGGIRPCNLAFGADQFNPNTQSGKKGVNSFFNWYFFTFTFAMMVSLTLIVYIQTDLSWSVGLGIPAALMLISCVIYFMGSKKYVKIKATGSPVTSVVQVLVVATKKRQLKLPENPLISLFHYMPPEAINTRLPYTPQFRFLNKAAIITPQDEINSDGSAANPWNLCSMQQVEEVKLLLRVIPIWASAVIYYLVLVVQQQTYSVFQAVQSDRTFGNTKFKIPAGSYGVFAMLSMTIWLPIYDRLIVPSLQRVSKKEGGITILQRMGIGILLSALSMIVAAVVEKHRRKLALTNPIGLVPRKGAISSMSAMWLVPQLALAGLAEAFTSVGQVEFYYKQFPENMRSIGGSLLYCGTAVSSYLSSFLISIIRHTTSNSKTGNWLTEDLNKGRLEYFYFIIAALEVVNLGYFLLCSSWYRYKGSGSGSSPELQGESKQSEKTADVV